MLAISNNRGHVARQHNAFVLVEVSMMSGSLVGWVDLDWVEPELRQASQIARGLVHALGIGIHEVRLVQPRHLVDLSAGDQILLV